MKIVLTTNHPAPYFDRLFRYFEKNSIDTEAWYNKSKSIEKLWKKYTAQNVHLKSELSIIGRIKRFTQYDFTVLYWGSKDNILIALALRLWGKRVAFYLDHPDPQSSRTTGIARAIKKMLMSSATYMFPACYSCADYIIKTYGLPKSKVRVFPYTHSERPKGIEEINKARQAALCNGRNIRLLIASRFVPRKGYAIVYDAFKALQKKGLLSQIDVRILGSGEELEEYKQKFSELSKDITFCGWVENDEYEQALNDTDIYLHPSLFEPFGIPPLDAMERSKMLIVSDGVKSTDIFTDSRGVMIYPAHDAQALADRIEECVSKKATLYDMTAASPSECQAKYSMEVNLKAITDK